MARVQITATYKSGREEILWARGPKTTDSLVSRLRSIPTVVKVDVKTIEEQ